MSHSLSSVQSTNPWTLTARGCPLSVEAGHPLTDDTLSHDSPDWGSDAVNVPVTGFGTQLTAVATLLTDPARTLPDRSHRVLADKLTADRQAGGRGPRHRNVAGYAEQP